MMDTSQLRKSNNLENTALNLAPSALTAKKDSVVMQVDSVRNLIETVDFK